MPGDFDESLHPRDPAGKFGTGGGSAGEKKQRSEKAAATVSKAKALIEQRGAGTTSGGHPKPSPEQNAARIARVTVGMDEAGFNDPAKRAAHLAEEHANIANEGEMLEAGHVKPVPTEKLEHYRSVLATTEKHVEVIKNNLDAANHDAMHAVAKLSAVSDDEHPELRHAIDHDELESAFSGSSASLHQVIGKQEGEDFRAHHDAVLDDHHHHESIGSRPDKEDVDDYDSPEDHAKAASAYDREFADRKALRADAAVHAQDALEKLHHQQIKALADLKDVSSVHDKAYRQMIKEASSHEEDGISDEVGRLLDHHDRNDTEPPPHVDQAQNAAQSMSRAAVDEREHAHDAMSGNLQEARSGIRGSIREVGKAIKQLSKVTGRAPKMETTKATHDGGEHDGVDDED